MEKLNCFAYGSATDNGCKALIKRECDKCKFYKTANDDEIQKLNCELRIRRKYQMSSKDFLNNRGSNND